MEDRPKAARPSVRRRPSAAKSATAAMPAASSPSVSPRSAFNMCGHDGCGTGSCNVRYVGPVSHLRDHHALHAARGVAHVWTAAIVSGLAVVLTGVLAYNAAQAATNRLPNGNTVAGTSDVRMMMERMDRLEAMMRTVADRCRGTMGEEVRQDGNGQAIEGDQNEGRVVPPLPIKKKPVIPTNTNTQ